MVQIASVNQYQAVAGIFCNTDTAAE